MSESNNTFMHLVRPNVIAPAAGSANGPANVKIQTPAILTILEIISQQILNKRIIGTLLGSRSDDGLEIESKDAFMVPINETGDSIAIEEQVHKSLYQLYKKAHPKESVLGWFGSSNKIDDITSLIHDFYSKGVDRAFPYPAVYLNVQYLTQDNKVTSPTFTTYIAASVGKPAIAAQQVGWKQASTPNNSYIFTPIPNEIIGTTTINQNNDVSFLNQNLDLVKENIQSVLKFIENSSTKNGAESDADLDILRLLSNNLLNKSPFTNLADFFNNHNQDLIMIEYLIRAVQDQIKLSEKLSAAF